MLYPINKRLQRNILSKIPQEYSKLEKAIFIYNELCTTLEYSMEYFLDTKKWQDWFTEINNLRFVDGVNNKQVVCYTFNCIFLELLDKANVCEDITFLINRPSTDSIILPTHQSLQLHIDGFVYDVDATMGILTNNDLVLSKYRTHKLMGWHTIGNQENKTLTQALNKVRNENNVLFQLQAEYLEQKKESFIDMPLQERALIFLEFAKSAPEYSILTFNYMLKLKTLLFKEEELVKPYYEKNNSTNIDLVFVKQFHLNEYRAIFLYNPDGYTDKKGCENFDSLQVYEISPKQHKVSQISLADLKTRMKAYYYVDKNDKPLSSKVSQIINQGRLEGYTECKDIQSNRPQPHKFEVQMISDKDGIERQN